MRKLGFLGLAAVLLGAWLWWNGDERAPVPSGAPLVTVSLPALDAVQERGRAAFETYCASCHGANAAGQAGTAPPLIHPIYEPGHHGDLAFLRAAEQGAPAHHWPFGDMPAVKGISEVEIAEIIAYIRALQRANGIH